MKLKNIKTSKFYKFINRFLIKLSVILLAATLGLYAGLAGSNSNDLHISGLSNSIHYSNIII